MPRSIARTPLWIFLCMSLGAGVAVHAADDAARTPTTTVPAPPPKPASDPLAPPSVVKPVVPSKAELAESAFKKLDATNKGYVTMEDTSGLDGFAPIFRDFDTDKSGKLDIQQFKKAWARYSGYKDKE